MPPSTNIQRGFVTGGWPIGNPFQRGRGEPGGWWIIDEPELHLAEDVLVPDIAVWRRERMLTYPDGAYFELAPDWVCEMLSPGTRQSDLVEKRAIYAREGVAHLWLVDPLAKSLEAFSLKDGSSVLVAALRDDQPVSLDPFDAITFVLRALWSD
ncbi:MAG: Uma2 family endonuclease [Pseudomonadota bacterium]